MDDARGAGPYPDDAKNLWSALTAPDPADSASPRTEVVHMVHSPKYYPGNCTISCWGGRSCPEVITVGDMKLSIGYIGDPRIVPLEQHAGVAANSTGSYPWGATGGHCNVKPSSVTGIFRDKSSTTGSYIADEDVDRAEEGTEEDANAAAVVLVNDTPDPTCARGVLSKVDHATCCSASCGVCGGVSCGSHPGGRNQCCRKDVEKTGRSCNNVGPPCKEGPPSPPPPPGPYADRCTAPGMKGTPKPTPHGQCVDGCLFNVTADPTEANNLFADPAYASIVASMKARLAVLGAAAPPWAIVPEVQNMTNAAFNAAKCAAAHKFGATAPIDV